MQPSPSRWSDYSNAMRAVLDEYACALGEYANLLQAVTPDQYVRTCQLGDDRLRCVRDIADHVVSAAYVYAEHIDAAIHETEARRGPRATAVDTPQAAVASTRQAFARTVEVLAPVKDYGDDDMLKPRFVIRWGVPYDLEQILEHAIVHILRHRRQIARWLEALKTG